MSPETLRSVDLNPGRGFPGDRAFALALPGTDFDEADPKPLSKFMFLMLARQEALARLVTRYDADSGVLLVRDDGSELSEDIRTASGRSAVEDFFSRFLPNPQAGARPRLVAATEHSFTDIGVHSNDLMHAVSVINLESVRDLERKLGKRVDPRRFRANILVEGLPPWVELDWLERELEIGNVRFRGARLTRRCPATEVNPDTAVRDIELPRELMHFYGHIHLGIYLYVLSAGPLSVGDVFSPPKVPSGHD
jgi:uncharacterized protein YcbX